jgi:sodium/bile acid cotransporter 7
MRSFLAKNWFLLALAAGVALALAAPGWVRPAAAWLWPSLIVALSLFLTSWAMEGRRLWLAVRRPWAALWAVAVGYGALPPLAWLLGLLSTTPDLALGLLLIASVPCTLSSAVIWTRLAGGDDAQALLGVLLLTGTGWLFTPLWLTLAAAGPVALPLAEVMGNLLLVLVAPVVLGQLSRRLPGVAQGVARRKHLNGVAVRLLVLAVILKAVADLPDRTAGLSLLALVWTALLCLAAHLAGVVLALGGGRLLGLGREGAIAAAFAGSQKTLPVALFLFEAYFRSAYPLAVVPLVLYHVGQLVVDTFLADRLARRTPADVRAGTGSPRRNREEERLRESK